MRLKGAAQFSTASMTSCQLRRFISRVASQKSARGRAATDAQLAHGRRALEAKAKAMKLCSSHWTNCKLHAAGQLASERKKRRTAGKVGCSAPRQSPSVKTLPLGGDAARLELKLIAMSAHGPE